MKQNPETMRYASMGMAALLPGMQYAIERMQAELDNMRARLAAMQNGQAPAKRPGKGGGTTGWPADPEERRREMARRMAKWKTENHRQKLSTAAKQRWEKMKPRQRKEQLAKMAAARHPKPTVRMEEKAS